MKRALLVVVGSALLAGCQHEASNQQMSRTETAQSARATDVPKPAANATVATPAKPASAKEYYEVTKNGKTYVFGAIDSLGEFRKTGALPANKIEKPAFGPAGETVVFEAGGLEEGLIAEFQKSHPKK